MLFLESNHLRWYSPRECEAGFSGDEILKSVAVSLSYLFLFSVLYYARFLHRTTDTLHDRDVVLTSVSEHDINGSGLDEKVKQALISRRYLIHDLDTAHTVGEKFCYVATDIDNEDPDKEEFYPLPDGSIVTPVEGRYTISEELFDGGVVVEATRKFYR